MTTAVPRDTCSHRTRVPWIVLVSYPMIVLALPGGTVMLALALALAPPLTVVPDRRARAASASA